MVSLNLYDKVLGRVTSYLQPCGWPAQAVGMALVRFELSQGEKAVEALDRYINFAEAHNEPPNRIAATIGHDFNGCDDKCFSPRTSSY